MSTYRRADKEAQQLIEELTDAHYQPLKDAGVEVGCLFAFAARDANTGEPKGPALKHAGYPALALVRVTSHKDRVAGLPDALVYVDGDHWPEWSEERRKAVLDHELHHLLVQFDEEGNVKLDDSHRPKLKLKAHDWQHGGFFEIAKRYKEAAPEVEAIRYTADKYGQLLFPY